MCVCVCVKTTCFDFCLKFEPHMKIKTERERTRMRHCYTQTVWHTVCVRVRTYNRCAGTGAFFISTESVCVCVCVCEWVLVHVSNGAGWKKQSLTCKKNWKILFDTEKSLSTGWLNWCEFPHIFACFHKKFLFVAHTKINSLKLDCIYFRAALSNLVAICHMWRQALYTWRQPQLLHFHILGFFNGEIAMFHNEILL